VLIKNYLLNKNNSLLNQPQPLIYRVRLLCEITEIIVNKQEIEIYIKISL